MKIHIIEPLAIDQAKTADLTALFMEAGHEVLFSETRNINADETIRRAAGADVVVIANQPFPEEVVNALPDLKLLAVAFTGLDHVAMDACKSKGITVCNASSYSNINVAELTIGLMIDVLRNITALDPVTRAGGTKEGKVGFDLCGKTVGIIGLGAIGQRVARILQGFECRILASDPVLKEAPHGLDLELTDMDSLLKESDLVTLHCPLNNATKGLIGARELGLMKKSAYLINCARGPVVEDTALVDALKNKKIAGAGIDVFAIEPPLNKEAVPVLELDNVVVTPHIAFATKEAFVRRADIVADNILSWMADSPKNVMS
ncbi:MAG: NAD(P)-dependent oxidoreductase [Spirochaetales bacterium]|nr:NAD(P)-dependent oxidoreductase [Spirochaetales bacterium]